MTRFTNFAFSGLWDTIRILRKHFSNSNILVFGSREGGKSTLQKHIYSDSSDFRPPEKTGQAGKTQTYNVNYLGDSYDSFKVKIQDVAGDRHHWSDTVRRVVNAKPKVIIFMLRAFELRPDGQEVKKAEHLMRVPDLMKSFRIMKTEDGMGRKKDVWYCGEDMEAFNFLRTLLFDQPNLFKNYPDVMAGCADVHNRLYKRKKKIIPEFLYVCVNFVDILPDDEIELRVKDILEPYKPLLMQWSDNKVKVRRIALSAMYGHNIDKLLINVGEDRKWT